MSESSGSDEALNDGPFHKRKNEVLKPGRGAKYQIKS